MIEAAELGALALEPFLAAVGGIYESSPWVAERTHAAGPFTSLTALHKVPRVVDPRSRVLSHLRSL
jgi:2-oxo-4-hydroxy-4-carboxy-5-ureidoimidazoline decarboxylase